MRNSNKSERLVCLKKLIGSGKFGDQDDLLAALKGQGFETTQATLSRDIAQLGAMKRDGRYAVGHLSDALGGQGRVMTMTFVAPNMIVIRTSPGLAQAAARLVDEFAIGGVAGTVAGDDTIFVAIESEVSHSAVLKTLSNLFSRVRRRS